jgi:hypothetical protein
VLNFEWRFPPEMLSDFGKPFFLLLQQETLSLYPLSSFAITYLLKNV